MIPICPILQPRMAGGGCCHHATLPRCHGACLRSATAAMLPRWLSASPPNKADSCLPLAPVHISEWRRHGVLVLEPGLFPVSLLTRMSEQVAVAASSDDEQLMRLPGADCVNKLALHPRLLASAAQLLHCPVEQLRLTQAHCWCKRGQPRSSDAPAREQEGDQRMHQDWPNNATRRPTGLNRNGGMSEAVAVHVYLSDSALCGGSTVRGH
eukprot:COSAG01_NODE_1820_length_9152_cov_22.869215_1_plen_210_part_00